MSFKQMQFQSDVINKIAKHVVSVYLLEGAMRILTDCFFDITIYEKKCYLFVVIIIFAVVIIVMCIIVDMIRSSIAGFVDRLVYSAGLKCYYWFRGRLETIESKYKKKV